MSSASIDSRLLKGDATLFEGNTAPHALGWLRHPDRYLGHWLDETFTSLPCRHETTLLLGMGGSSSPAKFYAHGRTHNLHVVDTSNPDTVSSLDFSSVNVIASSKSGGTVETQTLLAHALAQGLDARDLVIITDPGTSLEELGHSLGALVVLGDPKTGGRFSGLSPFGLVPALYAGWSVEELRDELAACYLTESLVSEAIDNARVYAQAIENGYAFYSLPDNPITSGPALWLEQLVAETTGKDGRGFIPIFNGEGTTIRPRDMQRLHLEAALLAWYLKVDPFNQPNVELAKTNVFTLLRVPLLRNIPADAPDAAREALSDAVYGTLQAYAPLASSSDLAMLRERCAAVYGTVTANLGPRYLHSTGQLHKGGPENVAGVQIIQRPQSSPQRISGRRYSFHDLHLAQALSDYGAMRASGRPVFQFMVEDFSQAAEILGL